MPRVLRWRFAALLVVAVLAAVGVLLVRPDAEPPADAGLSRAELRQRTGQVISSFENSTTTIQYGYAEVLDDGRGVTAGRAGFTSGTGDLLEVVQRYRQREPGNDLVRYLPALEAVNGSDSTAGLTGFVNAWKLAAHDPQLVAAQDDVYDELYFDPTLNQATSTGVTTAAGKLILLDTLVQQGGGDDTDGLPAIVAATDRAHGSADGDEQQWLRGFLAVRREHLENAADPSTRAAWRESVDRVTALETILAEDLSLEGLLHWNVYGDDYSVPALAT